MTLSSYQSIPIIDNNEPLVDLSNYDFTLEPSYFNQGYAKNRRMFLREGLVKKLLIIQGELKIYKFKIWDGYRSRNTQNLIYKALMTKYIGLYPDWNKEKLQSEVGKFITPANESGRVPPHATGGAVDLTLVDLNGHELDMGTGFDYFGPEASVSYSGKLSEPAFSNRKILSKAMLSQEFTEYADEWWHFDYGNQLWALTSGKPKAVYGEILST